MNDPLLLAKKLEELTSLASKASNGFEKASVYSACSCICKEFDDSEKNFDSYTLEKVSNACWHINAAVGYDITNEHDKEEHISWAYGELMTVKNLLQKGTKRT